MPSSPVPAAEAFHFKKIREYRMLINIYVCVCIYIYIYSLDFIFPLCSLFLLLCLLNILLTL